MTEQQADELIALMERVVAALESGARKIVIEGIEMGQLTPDEFTSTKALMEWHLKSKLPDPIEAAIPAWEAIPEYLRERSRH